MSRVIVERVSAASYISVSATGVHVPEVIVHGVAAMVGVKRENFGRLR
jgi:hypothetical protein